MSPTRRTPADAAEPPKTPVRVAALRLLGRREYTAAELTARLLTRGYAEDAVEHVVADLRRDGSIDDARAAAAHVRTATAIKGRGPRRIRRELEARGVDRAIVDRVTADLGADDERQAIARYLQRHLPTARAERATRQRIIQRLLRRGFTMDAILAALGRHAADD